MLKEMKNRKLRLTIPKYSSEVGLNKEVKAIHIKILDNYNIETPRTVIDTIVPLSETTYLDNIKSYSLDLALDVDVTSGLVLSYRYAMTDVGVVIDNTDKYEYTSWSIPTSFYGNQEGIKIDGMLVLTPRIVVDEKIGTLSGDVLSITSSDFKMILGDGRHKYTNWKVYDAYDNDNIIYSRKDDDTNLTSLTIPLEKFELSRLYVIECSYLSNNNIESLTAKYLYNRSINVTDSFKLRPILPFSKGEKLYYNVICNILDATEINIVIKEKSGLSEITKGEFNNTPMASYLELSSDNLEIGKNYMVYASIKRENNGNPYVTDLVYIHSFTLEESSYYGDNNLNYPKKYDALVPLNTGNFRGVTYQLKNGCFILGRNDTNKLGLYVREDDAVRYTGVDLELPHWNERGFPIFMVLPMSNNRIMINYAIYDKTFKRSCWALYSVNLATSVCTLINSVVYDDEYMSTGWDGSAVVINDEIYYIPNKKIIKTIEGGGEVQLPLVEFVDGLEKIKDTGVWIGKDKVTKITLTKNDPSEPNFAKAIKNDTTIQLDYKNGSFTGLLDVSKTTSKKTIVYFNYVVNSIGGDVDHIPFSIAGNTFHIDNSNKLMFNDTIVNSVNTRTKYNVIFTITNSKISLMLNGRNYDLPITKNDNTSLKLGHGGYNYVIPSEVKSYTTFGTQTLGRVTDRTFPVDRNTFYATNDIGIHCVSCEKKGPEVTKSADEHNTIETRAITDSYETSTPYEKFDLYLTIFSDLFPSGGIHNNTDGNDYYGINSLPSLIIFKCKLRVLNIGRIPDSIQIGGIGVVVNTNTSNPKLAMYAKTNLRVDELQEGAWIDYVGCVSRKTGNSICFINGKKIRVDNISFNGVTYDLVDDGRAIPDGDTGAIIEKEIKTNRLFYIGSGNTFNAQVDDPFIATRLIYKYTRSFEEVSISGGHKAYYVEDSGGPGINLIPYSVPTKYRDGTPTPVNATIVEDNSASKGYKKFKIRKDKSGFRNEFNSFILTMNPTQANASSLNYLLLMFRIKINTLTTPNDVSGDDSCITLAQFDSIEGVPDFNFKLVLNLSTRTFGLYGFNTNGYHSPLYTYKMEVGTEYIVTIEFDGTSRDTINKINVIINNNYITMFSDLITRSINPIRTGTLKDHGLSTVNGYNSCNKVIGLLCHCDVSSLYENIDIDFEPMVLNYVAPYSRSVKGSRNAKSVKTKETKNSGSYSSNTDALMYLLRCVLKFLKREPYASLKAECHSVECKDLTLYKMEDVSDFNKVEEVCSKLVDQSVFIKQDSSSFSYSDFKVFELDPSGDPVKIMENIYNIYTLGYNQEEVITFKNIPSKLHKLTYDTESKKFTRTEVSDTIDQQVVTGYTLVSKGKNVYVLGGIGDDRHYIYPDVYKFDTTTNELTKIGSLTNTSNYTSYSSISAFTRPDGKVILFNNSTTLGNTSDSSTIILDLDDLPNAVQENNDSKIDVPFTSTAVLRNGGYLRFSFNIEKYKHTLYYPPQPLLSYDDYETELNRTLIVRRREIVKILDINLYEKIIIEGDNLENTGKLIWIDRDGFREFDYRTKFVTRNTVLTQEDEEKLEKEQLFMLKGVDYEVKPK